MTRPLKNAGQARLSKPLKSGTSVQTNMGNFSHDDIIGQPKRIYLQYKKNKVSADPAMDKFLVTEPTLEEYILLVPRKAQPIYATDAAVVVSLAEIDADIPEDLENVTTKRYFEAGTGNGSLTLAICRAIHGANGLARHFGDPKLRGAVLHLVDRNEKYQLMGMTNVKNYKRGRYFGDVEFGQAELPLEWLQDKGQFHGVFLDLPDPHLYMHSISQHLHFNGTLVVFTPSVTQILKCKHVLYENKYDLSLVRTVELPPGYGGGIREWDLSTVKVRATGEFADVCRHRVGAQVVGGGFVGVFKRKTVPGSSVEKP